MNRPVQRGWGYACTGGICELWGRSGFSYILICHHPWGHKRWAGLGSLPGSLRRCQGPLVDRVARVVEIKDLRVWVSRMSGGNVPDIAACSAWSTSVEEVVS
jgi:hypothetical protein